MNQPSGSASNAALKPSNARQSKRLFIHNLPASATDESIINFFNIQLNGLNVIEGIDPCISCQIAKDRSFALIEFKTPAETTVGLALDGIKLDDSDAMETSNGTANGSAQGISVRRPKDYIVPSVTDDTDYQEGMVSSTVPDTQNKISITNIPVYLTDEQVTELLVSFGELKAFVLIKDRSTEESRVSTHQIRPCSHANKSPRVLPFANTLTLRLPISLSAASTAWNLVTSTSKSSAPVSESPRLPALKWVSTPCPYSPRLLLPISKKVASCSS